MKPLSEIDWPENDDTPGRLRMPYQTGIFARRAFALTLAFGRSLGLDIADHHDGGWMMRSEYIVAQGQVGALKRFVAAIEEWNKEWS